MHHSQCPTVLGLYVTIYSKNCQLCTLDACAHPAAVLKVSEERRKREENERKRMRKVLVGLVSATPLKCRLTHIQSDNISCDTLDGFPFGIFFFALCNMAAEALSSSSG